MAPPETTVPVPEPPSSRLYGRGAGYQARPMGAKLLTRQSGGVATPGAGIKGTTMAGGPSGPVSAGCPSAALVGRPVDAVERSMDLRLSAGGLGRYVVITIGGELDMTAAPELAEYLTAVLGRQAGQDVILDVRGVSFADVAGLRALLAADCTVKDSGGSLRLAGAPRQLRRVLAISGLTERLASYPSTYAASAWLPIPAAGPDPEPCAGPGQAPRPSRPGGPDDLMRPRA
ncbi:MAG: STAS domain-containing protein [Streptosporangiaceae bacterium]